MKFKVGQKVRVREDLEDGEYYGNYYTNDRMKDMSGKTVTIARVNDNYYRIEEDEFYYFWTDEMLEPAEYTYEDLCNSPIRNEDNI